MPDLTPLRYAVFGGVYNNYLSLSAVLDDAERRGASAAYCLGDLGGFGPHPDRVFPVLLERRVVVMQGNYDHSIGHQLLDCGCGYTDPRDNHYARLSYAYTQTKTSARWLPYLRALRPALRDDWHGLRVLMAHGSPRRVNEFLWESQCSDAFLRRLLQDYQADVLLDMRAEKLPEEFIETLATGYWTTCLEILPARERSRGIY